METYKWNTKVNWDGLKNDEEVKNKLIEIISSAPLSSFGKETISEEELTRFLNKRLELRGFPNESMIEIGLFENNSKPVKITTKSPISGESIVIDLSL